MLLSWLQEAIRCRPWSFEAHSGVVECNLLKLTAAAHSPSSASNSTATGVNPPSSKDNPHTQALLSALNAVKICGKSARTLTLLARVLRRDPTPHSATQPARGTPTTSTTTATTSTTTVFGRCLFSLQEKSPTVTVGSSFQLTISL